MIFISAFWGWIGPFLVASLMARGLSTDKAVSLGGTITAAIIGAGACSVAGEIILGFLISHSLTLVALVGGWIGFRAISDGSVYKAGLVEMVSSRICGVSPGLQSAAGLGITIVAPADFGIFLEWYNGRVEPTAVTIWAPAFLILALGGILSPITAFVLRRLPQAKLRCGGKM